MEIIDRKTAKARGLKHYFTGKPCGARLGHQLSAAEWLALHRKGLCRAHSQQFTAESSQ